MCKLKIEIRELKIEQWNEKWHENEANEMGIPFIHEKMRTEKWDNVRKWRGFLNKERGKNEGAAQY